MNEDNRKHFGFIAQEVKEIFPELVYEDDERYLGIDYIGFIPILIEQIKIHNNTIEYLKEEIDLIKRKDFTLLNSTVGLTFSKLFQNCKSPIFSTGLN
ncbi:MAG: tail fiber domain-containing protein [Flavobacteriales bacterium]|nr:tail fiber domain-containing protein [Flavobacteriales bacterium]